MKYYITYNLLNNKEPKYIGPFNEFHYMDKAMDLIQQDGVYNLDIVNEVAMEFYLAYLEVEKEYKDAKDRWIKYPPKDKSFSIHDEVNLSRELKLSLEDYSDNLIKDKTDTEKTIDTLSTLKIIEDNNFDNWDDDIPF